MSFTENTLVLTDNFGATSTLKGENAQMVGNFTHGSVSNPECDATKTLFLVYQISNYATDGRIEPIVTLVPPHPISDPSDSSTVAFRYIARSARGYDYTPGKPGIILFQFYNFGGIAGEYQQSLRNVSDKFGSDGISSMIVTGGCWKLYASGGQLLRINGADTVTAGVFSAFPPGDDNKVVSIELVE